VDKLLDFQPISLALCGKQYKIGPLHYGTVIGNHMCSIEACHFRWSWVTFEGHFSSVVTLCAQLTCNLLAVAKFLVCVFCICLLSIFSWLSLVIITSGCSWLSGNTRVRSVPSKLFCVLTLNLPTHSLTQSVSQLQVQHAVSVVVCRQLYIDLSADPLMTLHGSRACSSARETSAL